MAEKRMSRRAASALIQFRTSHSPLIGYLHARNLRDSPFCPYCPNRKEPVFHFLMLCPAYEQAGSKLRSAFPSRTKHIAKLLTPGPYTSHLMAYIANSGRFKPDVGSSLTVKSRRRALMRPNAIAKPSGSRRTRTPGFRWVGPSTHGAARDLPLRTSPKEMDDRMVWRMTCRVRKESRVGTRNRVRDEKHVYKENHTPHAYIPPSARRAP
jgi:hypothetical protein